MFYLLEHKPEDKNDWLVSGYILSGDFHIHLKLLKKLRKDNPGVDFRAKRLKQHEAKVLFSSGLKLMVAPNA
jgi:hypothetical protein